MKAFRGLLIASFKQFFRDKAALFFTFAFPILFMFIFGLIYSGEGNLSYDIGLVNQDISPAGAATAQGIKSVPIFKVTEGVLDTTLAEMRDGKYKAVVVIPPELAVNVSRGEVSNVKVYYDPSDMASQTILPVLRQVIEQINQQLSQRPVLLAIEEKSISAHQFGGMDFLIPGILAMSILFLGLFGALPMVEWREKQVLKRLGATPLTRSNVVFSQVFYRVVLALAQTVVIILLARFVFGVNMVGNWFLLFGMVILGTLTFVSIGYLAIARARTTESAMPVIQLIQFPMLFLSGVFFPIEIMPSFMKPIVAVMPLSYLGDGLRQIMVEATPQNTMPVNALVLGAWFVVSSLLAIRFFKWE